MLKRKTLASKKMFLIHNPKKKLMNTLVEERQQEEIEVDEARPLPVHPVSPENSPSKKRSAYCAQISDLSEQMRAFLSDVRCFLTQRVNFERRRPALS